MRLVEWISQLLLFQIVSGTAVAEETVKEEKPLKTKDLFQSSENYKCLVEGNKDYCAGDSKDQDDHLHYKVKYGPKFQRIHLALPRLEPMEVGYKRIIELNGGKQLEMTTLSTQPPIFEIPNFLDKEECEAIIYLANEKGMKKFVPTLRKCLLPDKVTYAEFDQWDKNMDGLLSKQEIARIPELSSYLFTDEDITNILEKTSLDKDKDGQVSLLELNDTDIHNFKETIAIYNKNRNEKAFADVQQTWLWQDEDELLSFDDVLLGYHERLENLTKIPKGLIEQTEPLQVVRHGKGSSTPCHHDSDAFDFNRPCCMNGARNCRMCRYLTVMYFLNDVPEGGELTFPLADGITPSAENISWQCTNKCSWNRSFPLSNLRIKPQRGKAILSYNHLLDDGTGWLGDLDSFSLQSEAEVLSGEKWVAKLWLDIIGDGVTAIRPWKSGSNWLDGVNKNHDVVEKMRNDHFIEGRSYYHGHLKYSKPYNRPTPVETPTDSMHINTMNFRPSSHKPIQTEVSPNDRSISDFDATDKGNQGGTIDESVIIETVQDGKESSEPVASSEEEEEPKWKLPTPPKPKQRGHKPLGPPPRAPFPDPLPAGNMEGNKLVRSVLLLIDELERDELEIIARVLHEKLQLACIPLMVNPIGPI